jgi:hypothetical protein
VFIRVHLWFNGALLRFKDFGEKTFGCGYAALCANRDIGAPGIPSLMENSLYDDFPSRANFRV